MKHYLTLLSLSLRKRISRAIAVITRSDSFCLDYESRTFIKCTHNSSKVLIVSPDLYMRFEKTYSVISRKELHKVINNELSFNAPFESSYSLYKIVSEQDGVWTVVFYYIESDRVKHLDDTPFIIVAEELLMLAAQDAKREFLILQTPIGKYLVQQAKSIFSIRKLDNGESLRNSISLNEVDTEIEERFVSEFDMYGLAVQYIFSTKWHAIKGTLNSRFFNIDNINIQPKYLFYPCLLIATSMLLQSLYFVTLGAYLERLNTETLEIRESFVSKKAAYSSELELYKTYYKFLGNRTNISTLPALISQMPEIDKLVFTRLDARQNQITLVGTTSNVELMMQYLSNHKSVSELDFISPISPNKRGGDNFAIKFELVND